MSREEISQGTPALRVIRAGNPSPMTLDGTRTYLVGRRRPVVIDPGPDDAAHRDAILSALAGATPAAILLTHAHPDHAAGAPALARATGAPIHLAHGLQPQGDGSPDDIVWIADGERVESDAGSLRAVATPGHTPDHMAYWWRGGVAPERGALFVGDLLMGEGDTTLVAPPEGGLAAYLRSLDRVAALAPEVLFPAHGPPLTDPASAVARYRAHREARVERVKAALRESPHADLDLLVRLVYGPDLQPALRGAAAGSIRAIIEYLKGSA